MDSVTAVCQATNILQLKSPYEAHPTARSVSQTRSSLSPKATQANQSSEDLNLGYMDLNRFFSSFFGSLIFDLTAASSGKASLTACPRVSHFADTFLEQDPGCTMVSHSP